MRKSYFIEELSNERKPVKKEIVAAHCRQPNTLEQALTRKATAARRAG